MKERLLLDVRDWQKKANAEYQKPLTRLNKPYKRSPVGARGFEPPTSCTPCKRASRSAPRPEYPS